MSKAWYSESGEGPSIRFSPLFAKAVGFKLDQEVDVSIDEKGNLIVSLKRNEQDLREIRDKTRKLISKYHSMLQRMRD